MNATDYIKTLDLDAHPEGGFYRRIYQSDIEIEFKGFLGKRYLSTAIQYLLCGQQYSAWHRIKSDELWVLSAGNTPMRIFEMTEGDIKVTELSEFSPQYTVKANTWFAAELTQNHEDAFALCHCVVSPGFDFADFEMAGTNFLESLKPEVRKKGMHLLK